MGTPIIEVDGLVSVSNCGVDVNEKALLATPEELWTAVQTAYSVLNNPPPQLLDAWCGGCGSLSGYDHLDFSEYLDLLREIEITEAAVAAQRVAKKHHTKVRRSEFNRQRSALVLAMLDAGIPYVCSLTDCNVTEALTVDHIKPLSRGGTDDLKNLRFLCLPHNSSKGDRNEVDLR